MKGSKKIHILYSRGDKARARDAFVRLKAEGFDPWLDVESIPAGGEWRMLCAQAIRRAKTVLILLSRRAVTRDGFLQREIHLALETWQEKAPGRVYLIPARLEPCPQHERLAHLNWIDLFDTAGWAQLISQLHSIPA